jgi:hypothetical protein
MSSDALARAKETAAWDATQQIGTSHSPDDRTIPFLLSGILDALVAIAERTSSTPHEQTADDRNAHRGASE